MMTDTQLAVAERGHVAAPHAHAAVLDFSGGTLRDKWDMAQMLSQSTLVPSDFRGKPGDILIVADLAASLGMSVAQGLQSIACINGRPSMWGDGLKGVVYRSPLCEWIKESEIGKCVHCALNVYRGGIATEWLHDGTNARECRRKKADDAPTFAEASIEDPTYGYRCTAKRVGDPNPMTNDFTIGDAKRANLLNKKGPWSDYGPRRMCRMRARSWTLRDLFPDVLKGLAMREEIVDIPDEVRAAVLGAPTRTDALKAALAIKSIVAAAPAVPETRVDTDPLPTVTATTEATPEEIAAIVAAAAAADPDFSKKSGAEIKAYVADEAEKAGVKPWQLDEIKKSTEAGRLMRSNVAEILRLVRERALRAGGAPAIVEDVPPVDPAPAAVLDEVPPDDPPPVARVEPAVDFVTMTSEQLLDHATDHAFAMKISEPAFKIILRAHADGGVTAANIATVLAEIDKRAAKA